MPRYDRSRTAVILSGLGAILLMSALYIVIRGNLPRLLAAIPLVIAGASLTGFYGYKDFLPQIEPDDPAPLRKQVRISKILCLGGLSFGLLMKFAPLNDWRWITGVDAAGLIVMVAGMVLMILVRLQRFERLSA